MCQSTIPEMKREVVGVVSVSHARFGMYVFTEWLLVALLCETITR